jgi:hypothetical protein
MKFAGWAVMAAAVTEIDRAYVGRLERGKGNPTQLS